MIIKPITSCVLEDEEKTRFKEIILSLKTLAQYVTSLEKKVHKDGDLNEVKSHDYHVLVQDILPLCM